MTTHTASDGAVFADDWLARRERADHRSRAHELTDAAGRYLMRTGHKRTTIADLGAGRGSNLRYLAPRLPSPRHWRLLDHDPALLATIEAGGPALPAGDALDTRAFDLAGDLSPALSGAHLVTASALVDLVSKAWLDRLSAVCAAQRSAVLITLGIDGTLVFRGPADAGDAEIRAALAADQRRDKGLGRALGARGPACLINTLSRHGFAVTTMPSPWRLGQADAALAGTLIEGWREAATRQRPASDRYLADWAARRARMVGDGEAELIVGHVDVLGLPGPACGHAERRRSRS